jgi:hypothetical protein
MSTEDNNIMKKKRIALNLCKTLLVWESALKRRKFSCLGCHRYEDIQYGNGIKGKGARGNFS